MSTANPAAWAAAPPGVRQRRYRGVGGPPAPDRLRWGLSSVPQIARVFLKASLLTSGRGGVLAAPAESSEAERETTAQVPLKALFL